MMGTPNPLVKTKGAGTTFWLYTGSGDAFKNPLADDDWLRLAGIKDLQPGEMSADAEDDDYLDGENADWKSTTQGQKSVGDTTATLAWKPGETGQKKLVELFDTGEVRAFRIRYPNGTVDVFRGWLSSLGKTVTSKEVMTRSVKITGVGRPSLAEEDTPDVVSVSGVTVAPASATVAAGATTTLTFTVKPDNASDKTLQVATADPLIATVTLKDNVATVKGVKAGSVNIVGISSDGSLVAVAAVTVTAS
ncbi:phage tail protein [Salmonella enterica]|nr:phage tail protein [Salmonella enterica]